MLKNSGKQFSQMATHNKARRKHYDGADGGVDRFPVPDNLVHWTKPFTDYKPVQYTWSKILTDKPVWADPDVTDKDAYAKIKFNQIDGSVDRTSFVKKYEIVDGVPRNPIGRTGVTGRGMLGKWGPNHAADPIVTRWKRDASGQIMRHDGLGKKPILEFVSIQRGDTKEWAIPGGMVDANEEVSLTLKREFNEEALNSLEGDQKEQTKKDIAEVFKNGEVVFKGYIDDPRNTDNAWMESVACNFHDEHGTAVGKIPLSAGDDAQAVQWLTIDKPLSLYASHSGLVEKVCLSKGAYFGRAKHSDSFGSFGGE